MYLCKSKINAKSWFFFWKADLIDEKVLHAGLAEAEVPQVPEHEPAKCFPVVTAGKDDPWKPTLILLVEILPS